MEGHIGDNGIILERRFTPNLQSKGVCRNFYTSKSTSADEEPATNLSRTMKNIRNHEMMIYDQKIDDHYRENSWSQFKDDVVVGKLDLRRGVSLDTVTTVTASSYSSGSFTTSNKFTSPTDRHEREEEFPGRRDFFDDIEMSTSYDSHFEYLASQPTTSMKLRREALEKEKEEQNRNELPPIPRSPSPFHSRLSETYTKSYTMRQDKKEPKKNSIYDKRPPFYTTIAKANSFSDTTVSSVSMLSFKKATKKATRTSSSFHNRLAVSQTISSSLYRQERKDERNRIETKIETNQPKKKPFYTTVIPQLPKSPSRKISSFDVRLGMATRDRRFMSSTMQKVLNAAYTDLNEGNLDSTPRPSSARSSTARPSTVRPSTVRPSTARSSTARLSPPKLSTTRPNTARPNSERPRTARQRKSGPSVYDRLSKTGTVSSLQRNRNSLQYKEEVKTLHESCKTALMREFKGSTFVPVTKGRVSKSVIGSVVNCGK